LKNAQEMLSCEGVAASLFYGINSDESIMNSYMPIDYYNKFLIKPLSDEVDIKEMFTPFENVVLKNLWVMSKIKEDHRDGVSPFMDFIKTWCQAFPTDREKILQIFIYITAARTIDNDTAGIYEKMSLAGMMGRMEEFIKIKDEYAAHVDSLIKGVLDGQFQIDGNIGKEIWIENPKVNTPWIFWPGEEKKPLRININTASLYQLESFPKITCDAAGKIIERRDSNGYIDCIDKEYFLE
jgi:hypothetical protein